MLRPFILLSLMATAFAAKKTFLAKAPESEKGPPSLKCIPRKERPFADIKDGGLKGSYPKFVNFVTICIYTCSCTTISCKTHLTCESLFRVRLTYDHNARYYDAKLLFSSNNTI